MGLHSLPCNDGFMYFYGIFTAIGVAGIQN
jgi:hypothetical protein